jgi:transcriptional antiterminator RfaH
MRINKGVIVDMDFDKNTKDQHWWVVQTKPQGEALAIAHLEQQGMTTYCPMFRQESIRRRQVKVNTVPLFPRYVFVLADLNAKETVHTIRSTAGVSRLIKVGDQPSTVKSDVIDQIRVLEASHLQHIDQHFKADDAVLITDGLYQGLEAVYQMENGMARAVVLLNLLQHPTRLTIDKTQLKKNS